MVELLTTWGANPYHMPAVCGLARAHAGACVGAPPPLTPALLPASSPLPQERHGIFHTELVSTAFMLAAKAHQGQMRKDGTSMLSHSVLVSLNLAELGLDSECVAAGLLHEVLRLNPGFRSQMEEFMPSAVVQLVDRVTTISEISQLYRNNRSSMGDEKMRRSKWGRGGASAIWAGAGHLNSVATMRTLGEAAPPSSG